MSRFKKGDKVKIRYDASSPYWGKLGIIEKDPVFEFGGFSYKVKLDLNGFPVVSQFMENDLENIKN